MAETAAARFGRCVVCGRVSRLTRPGLVWRHTDGHAEDLWCAGWREPPSETVSVDPDELCVDCRANLRQTRGLCASCYKHHRANATLDRWPGANRDPGHAPTEPTYRQLDYWTRVGYLHPDNPTPGCGTVRYWPASERRIAATMVRLTAAGIPPRVAHDVARAGGRLEIAPGVIVAVSGG